MGHLLERLRRCRAGATAIEYGLVAALIAVAVIAVVATIGGQTTSMWSNTATRFPTVQN